MLISFRIYIMAKYINLNSNSLPPLNNESSSIFSRVMTAGSSLNTNTFVLIGGVLFFAIVAVICYYYYVPNSSAKKYAPNNELIKAGSSNQAELFLFYADWCPHCKTAKPVWNDLKTEYENKTINGYQVIFTEIDCSEETTEVEKMMNQYSVEGFPTIKLLKDGQIIEYDAKPTRETIIKFLNTVL
jgi:thiol-disulfide isomerase/thioredoxin